jgi:hypothetical protein
LRVNPAESYSASDFLGWKIGEITQDQIINRITAAIFEVSDTCDERSTVEQTLVHMAGGIKVPCSMFNVQFPMINVQFSMFTIKAQELTSGICWMDAVSYIQQKLSLWESL